MEFNKLYCILLVVFGLGGARAQNQRDLGEVSYTSHSFGIVVPGTTVVQYFEVPLNRGGVKSVTGSCSCIAGEIIPLDKNGKQMECLLVKLTIAATFQGTLKSKVIVKFNNDSTPMVYSVDAWACPEKGFIVLPKHISLFLAGKPEISKISIFGRRRDVQGACEVVTKAPIRVISSSSEPLQTTSSGVFRRDLTLEVQGSWNGELNLKSQNGYGAVPVSAGPPPESVTEIRLFLGIVEAGKDASATFALRDGLSYTFEDIDPDVKISEVEEVDGSSGKKRFQLKFTNNGAFKGRISGKITCKSREMPGNDFRILYDGLVL